jgi:hypothetical protein
MFMICLVSARQSELSAERRVRWQGVHSLLSILIENKQSISYRPLLDVLNIEANHQDLLVVAVTSCLGCFSRSAWFPPPTCGPRKHRLPAS